MIFFCNYTDSIKLFLENPSFQSLDLKHNDISHFNDSFAKRLEKKDNNISLNEIHLEDLNIKQIQEFNLDVIKEETVQKNSFLENYQSTNMKKFQIEETKHNEKDDLENKIENVDSSPIFESEKNVKSLKLKELSNYLDADNSFTVKNGIIIIKKSMLILII